MKIALISSSIFPVPPTSYGGLERVVFDLAVELSQMSHDVTVFAPKGSNLPEPIEVVETVDPQVQVHKNWFEKEQAAYDAMKDKLEGFDVLHDHSWFAHIYSWKLGHMNSRVLHTHHGMMAWESPPPVSSPNLVGISNDHALEISLALGLTVRCAHNGVDLSLYPYKEEKGERFLFLSRISDIKGAHVAIQLAKKLRLPLDVAGGDTFVDDQAYVMRVKEQCDGHLIRYIGEVSHEEKVRLMQDAAALIFPPQPPFREPFGLVPVEAMACGTPVIATDNGAVKEVVKHGVSGFVCKSFDEMVDAVKKVEDLDPKACRERAERFSRKLMAKRYVELYADATSGIEW